MGRKLFKTTKMKNPISSPTGRQNTDSTGQDLDSFCFICGEVTRGKSIPLMMTYTPYSNIDLPRKIGQLMGDGFMVIVGVSDTLCRRCSSLINQLDKLEFETGRVKSALTGYLKAKYQLNDDFVTPVDVVDEKEPDSPDELCEENYLPVSLANAMTQETDVGSSINDIKCDAGVSLNGIKNESLKVEECASVFDNELATAGGEMEQSTLSASETGNLLENVMESDLNELVDNSVDTVTLYKCNSCSYKTLLLENFMEHLKIHSKKIVYKCTECFEQFQTKEDVSEHVMKVHGAPDIEFRENIRELEDDPDYYPSSKKMYECNTCKFRHNNKKVFDTHVRKHSKSGLFVCHVCSKIFKHKITLRKHMFSHRTYKCQYCSAVFQNEASLSHHFKVHSYDVKVSTESAVLPTAVESSLLPLNVQLSQTDFSQKSEAQTARVLTIVSQEGEESQVHQYDQVEVLLEKIHSGSLDDNLSLEGAIVKVVCENTVKGEEVPDTNTEHDVAVCTNAESISVGVGSEKIKEYLENSENYTDDTQGETEEGIMRGQDILKILNDEPGDFKDGDENFVYAENITAEVNKENIILDIEDSLDLSKKSFIDNSIGTDEEIQRVTKVYICSLCGLRTQSETHMKRHFKCHIALQKKIYKCHICERVLTTLSNLKRHISLHENCGSGEVQCNMCDEVLTDRLHLKHHMEIKHPESYQCSFCERKFDNKKTCREHEVTHPALQCDVCQKMFLTEGRLRSHKLFMHSDCEDRIKAKTFKCHICFKIFTTYHNLKRHLRNHERSSGAVKCALCNEELADKLLLRQHVEEKHPENHQCSFCHKVFANRKSCKTHEMTHPERFVYKCEKCDKLFLTEARLKRHEDTMHRDLHCRVCKKEIPNPLKLLDHERRHERHKAMFPCEQCPKVFRTPSGLKYHMSVHTGKYAVYCEICGKGLHSEVVLEEHKATHTKEVRYTCEKCGRTFSSNSTYRMHRLWHDNPLPYKCNICDRKFKHTSILAVHKRRAHTGERPYKCPYCSLTFSVSSTLNKHVILHTKQYPYRCELCTKGFTTRTKIAKHMAKVHNDFEMLNLKKKPCEYKMVLHPNELPPNEQESNNNLTEEQHHLLTSVAKEDIAEPLLSEEMLQNVSVCHEEEVQATAVQLLEHVTVDTAQAAIFTIFHQDLPSSDFTLHEFDATQIK